jgi:lysophospholipid acyltransferase (LPLAT)-like uncharacterized protein
MKIRHPALIKAAAFLGTWTIRGWLGTLKWSYHSTGPSLDPTQPALPGRYIYAIWHEYCLLPLYRFACANAYLLVSKHVDGTIYSEIARNFGVGLVRGSTNRGGLEAMRELLRLSRSNVHLALTPDGPRGPRRHIQPGLIYLAARTGMPIVPVGFGLDRPYRLQSWDRFALPRPGSRCAVISGEPMLIPPETTKKDMEPYRLAVEQAMELLSAKADGYAATGSWPASEEHRAAA